LPWVDAAAFARRAMAVAGADRAAARRQRGWVSFDGERRHDLDAAIAEYDRLVRTYPTLGYEVIMLPKASVTERADFILDTLVR
jgi:predicted ATPase